jgi:hypothetical protein
VHTLLLIVAIHGLLVGFAFLIAGWSTLLVAESEEEAEVKRGYEEARKRGWFEVMHWYARFHLNFASASRLAANWKARRDARRFIYVGLAFVALAAILGFPLGAYK